MVSGFLRMDAVLLALSMQLFVLNCFVVLRMRRWGDRLCSRFDPNLESPVIYSFDGMQAVLNSRSTHLDRSLKTRLYG